MVSASAIYSVAPHGPDKDAVCQNYTWQIDINIDIAIFHFGSVCIAS